MKEATKKRKPTTLEALTRTDRSVLRAIYLLAEPTRAAIAKAASLSTVSVTAIIDRLSRLGFVAAAGQARSSGGRRPAIYRMSSGLGYTLGVAVDTEHLRVVALNAIGELVENRSRSLSLSDRPEDHLGEILEQVTSEVNDVLSGVLKGKRVLSLGITPPGMVDTSRGLWLHGLQLSGIEHVDLRSLMSTAFKVPVVVEDPARSLAWVHARHLPPEEANELLFLYLSTGVGVGTVVNGELYRGHRGLAGEAGHLIVDSDGDRCSCGSVGCLETVVSIPSILQRFRRRLAERVISSLQRFNSAAGNELTMERIHEAALAGDRLATSTLFEIGTFLGDACAVLVKLYNPRTLLIGGPTALFRAQLLDPIWLQVRQQVMPEMLQDLRIDFVPYDPADDALGAALIAERAFWRSIVD